MWVVLEWIERHCVVPDGFRKGAPFRLYEYQGEYLASFYRVRGSTTWDPASPVLAPAFVYRRGLLVGPQKVGKNPLIAAQVCAEGIGPVVFAGWADADDGYSCADRGCRCGWEYAYDPGEPMGMAWPTPLIQITAFSEDSPLALDTVVPTPAGWTTVGNIGIGDEVITPEGMPVRVGRLSSVQVEAECYAVEFSDGERIVASAAHGWTLERRTRKGNEHERVTVTTEQMAADLFNPRGGKRYRMAMSEPWVLPEAHVPIDPYLLGLWLGDGSKADATIATDSRTNAELATIIEPLLLPHEEIVWNKYSGNQGALRIRRRVGLCAWGHEYAGDLVHGACGQCRRIANAHRNARPAGPKLTTFRERLRAVGVLHDKHIPPTYLRASIDQRWSLLQGLIDSDGHVAKSGQASFVNINQALLDGICELLTSLGLQWHRRALTMRAGAVFFVPTAKRPVARLSSKVNRHRRGDRKRLSAYRYVVSVDPVPSVPVRCIGIDTEDHLFLVGRRGVATHNTENTYDALRPMIELGPLADLIPKTGEEFIRLPGGGRIDTVTSSNQSRLGQRATFIPQDEVGLWTRLNKMVKLADTQYRNLAGMGGRASLTSNAWDPAEHSVAQREYESAAVDVHRQFEQPPRSLSYGDKRERRKIHQAVYPADTLRQNGGHVDLDSIEGEAADLAEKDLPQAERFFGNRLVAGAGAAVEPDQWDALARPQDVLEGTYIGAGFDGSINEDETWLRGCTAEGYRFTVGRWARPEGSAWLQWQAEHPGEQWKVDRLDVHAKVEWMFSHFNVGRMQCDPFKWWTEVQGWAVKYGLDSEAKPRVRSLETNQERRFAPVVDRWRTSIREGRQYHDGDPACRDHVLAARLKKARAADSDADGRTHYVIVKGEDRMRIDGAVADALALDAAMTMPPAAPPVGAYFYSTNPTVRPT